MRVTKTYDDLLELASSKAVTASAAGTDSTAAAIVLDLGAGDVEGDIVIDVSAMDVNNSNELYSVGAQISSVAAMTSDLYEICTLQLGDSSVIPGDTDMTTGRYILPFQNRIAGGTAKRYLRIYVTISGTVAGAGITYAAYLAKK